MCSCDRMDSFTELAKLSKDVADDTPLLAALALRFEAGAYVCKMLER